MSTSLDATWTGLTSFTHPVTAVVVGASRGMGLAFVDSLLHDPAVARVFAASRRAEAEDSLTGLAREHGGRVRALDLDVTAESTVSTAAATIAGETDRVDVVVYCAGLLHDGDAHRPEKRLADVTLESLQRSFAVNAIGPALVAKHFNGLLDRTDRAVFASLSARVGSIDDNRLGGWYGYRASKAAQNMITRNLSIELRRTARGVICVALHPGTVDTTLSRPFQGKVPEGKLFSPTRAAAQLLGVVDQLRPEDNGSFLAWDGQPIPW